MIAVAANANASARVRFRDDVLPAILSIPVRPPSPTGFVDGTYRLCAYLILIILASFFLTGA
jgi:hypothetical protein